MKIYYKAMLPYGALRGKKGGMTCNHRHHTIRMADKCARKHGFEWRVIKVVE